MSTPKVFAFAVSSTWFPGHETIINSTTRGKAKYDQWLNIRDIGGDMPITAMRARKIGAPQTSEAFERVAAYRNRKELRCGTRVRMEGGATGTIVGHNSSANFDVLLDSSGQTGNVHTGEILEVIEDD
jgi:hypothetical protein